MKLDELLFDLDMGTRETSRHREFIDLNDYAEEIAAALDLLPRCAALLRELKAKEADHGKAKENA